MFMTDIKSLIDEGFRGNILIVRKGAVLYESSSGFADLANEIPNTMDTRFATA